MALLVFFLVLCLSPITFGRVLEKDTINVGLKYNEKLCEACEMASAEVSSLLSDSNTSATITDAVESAFCSKFTGSVKDQCELLVEDYIPDILSTLETSLSTGKLCSDEKICDYQAQKRKSGPSYSKCNLCESAANEIQSLIQKNETQTQIISMMYSVCSKIKGGTVADACENLVDAYYPDLLDIVSSLSASELCSYVGYCSVSERLSKLNTVIPSFTKKDVAFSSASTLRQPGDCFACKMMVAYFRNKLKDTENQEKFKNTLLTSCDKVPNYVEECREAVVEYLPTLYANMDTIFNSTVICEKAGACIPHYRPLIRFPFANV